MREVEYSDNRVGCPTVYRHGEPHTFICLSKATAGRGTIKIIETCKQADLPEPEMKEQDGGFIITLFKDNLTEERLTNLGLNDRQVKAVNFVKQKGKITNKEYQELFAVSRETSSRDLAELTEKGIFENSGIKGAGSFFRLK